MVFKECEDLTAAEAVAKGLPAPKMGDDFDRGNTGISIPITLENTVAAFTEDLPLRFGKIIDGIQTVKGYGPYDAYLDFAKYDRPTKPEVESYRDTRYILGHGATTFGGKYAFHDRHRYPNRTVEKDVATMYFRPFFRNYLNDFMSIYQSNALNTRCWDRETKAMECIEYYGLRQGGTICKNYYDDFVECRTQRLQTFRREAIQSQMKREHADFLRGERAESPYKPIPKAHALRNPNMKHEDMLRTFFQ